MAYSYTTRNGKRIEVHAAAAFDAMAAGFGPTPVPGGAVSVRGATRVAEEVTDLAGDAWRALRG